METPLVILSEAKNLIFMRDGERFFASPRMTV